MLLYSLSPVFLAVLTTNAFTGSLSPNCGEAGCISLWVKKIPTVDVKGYTESLKSRVTALTVSTYRSPMVSAVIRPLYSANDLVDPSIPPMCRPSNFKNYRNFVDKRKFEKRSHDSSTKSDCCVHCHKAGDCFAYEYDPIKSQCNFYVTAETLDEESKTDICPSGKGAGYLELPNYPIWPSHFGHEAGPCLSNGAHQHKMGHGIDIVGYKDSPDQAIFDAQRDANQVQDDDDDDLDDYEL